MKDREKGFADNHGKKNIGDCKRSLILEGKTEAGETLG